VARTAPQIRPMYGERLLAALGKERAGKEEWESGRAELGKSGMAMKGGGLCSYWVGQKSEMVPCNPI
jgi:hypothetical protein